MIRIPRGHTNRYQRQHNLTELGANAQSILSKKTIVIIGGGGLGSHTADLMVRIGIGNTVLIDDDIIELSNLHRTALLSEHDIGKAKVDVLADKLSQINSEVSIKSIRHHISKTTIKHDVQTPDLILDCTDNLSTRFLLNEYSIQQHIPWVYAGVYATTGMVMGILPGKTPCLRCIMHTMPDKEQELIPVFGILTATIASIQSVEAVKILLDQHLSGLLFYNIWTQQFDSVHITKNFTCPICVDHTYTYLDQKKGIP